MRLRESTGAWFHHQVVLVQQLASRLAYNSSPSLSDETHTCWHTQRRCMVRWHDSAHVDCEGICAGYTVHRDKVQTFVTKLFVLNSLRVSTSTLAQSTEAFR